MVWTIKNKLTAIIISSALAIAGLILISLNVTSTVSDAKSANDVRLEQMNLVSDLRLELKTMILGAMDTIVDKDSGEVSPELKAEIEGAGSFIRNNLGALSEVADTTEERQLAKEIETKFLALSDKIQVDLYQAVRAYADDSVFAELDDVIDGTGVEIGDSLARFHESVSAEFAESGAELEGAVENSTTMIMVFGFSAVLALSFAIWRIAGSISGPITRMVSAMGSLANNDLNVEIPAKDRNDEVGEMAGAVQIFKDNAEKMAQMESERVLLEERSEQEKREMMNKLADDFESSIGGVVESVSSASTEMQSSAGSMSSIAQETNTQVENVAATSEQSSANMKAVAVSVEEMRNSIGEISRQTSHSTDATRNAVDEASKTQGTIQEMASAVSSIGDIVGLITDIAEQTNLLALNATIEAARAGEAGKGFAVVAHEVKELASQTAKATDEIGQQIGQIQNVTDSAVNAIESIVSTITQVNDISTAIASAVEEQNAASLEISENVDQVSSGTQEVASTITLVSQAAGETGAAANQMTNTADELSQQSVLLRSEVGEFLAQIRAS